MLDHIFLTVADLKRSIAFYEKTLAPLGIEHAFDYDGKDGPEGHPDLKGFGRDNRLFLWLRKGRPEPQAVHVGFVARSKKEVQAFYRAAMAAVAFSVCGFVGTIHAAEPAFDGGKSTWHDGFVRYDFVMDDETLAITPFTRPEKEGFAVGSPAKGQRRCIVVVPNSRR